MELIFKIHENLPRQGPGLNVSTAKAFNMLPEFSKKPVILDIGCGSGMQTIELARISGGYVTGLEVYQPFLDDLEKNADKAGFSDRVNAMQGFMLEMDFKEESFDVIWAEGSIFIIGFEKGLTEWRKFLKPGGYVAITEACWLKKGTPKELYDFWQGCYPGILIVEENISIIEKCGYSLLGHFTQPEEAWWDYYNPRQERHPQLRKEYADNSEAQELLDFFETEISIYRKYSEWYGYEFFIIQKR